MRTSFLRTFNLILAGVGTVVGSGCGESSTAGCGLDRLEEGRLVPAVDVLAALADAEFSQQECADLCGVSDWDYVETCSVVVVGSDVGAAGAPGMAAGAAGAPAEPELSIDCEVTGATYYCEGRRHACWGMRKRTVGSDPVGRWLARGAANEAASVWSFRCLSRELRGAGFSRLARSAQRAARQEVRHARLLTRLAESRGCARPPQEFRVAQERSLLALALENAREGCVGETYAGLVALHQAQNAEDDGVRIAFAAIAREEAEHADLAWEIHGELCARLSDVERSVVDDALRRAITLLGADHGSAACEDEEGHRQRQTLGLPSPVQAASLRRALADALRA